MREWRRFCRVCAAPNKIQIRFERNCVHGTGAVAQLVEYLLSLPEALSLMTASHQLGMVLRASNFNTQGVDAGGS